MAKLLLLCNVERLPAWDNPSGSKIKAFGLNLSVAIDSPVDPKWLADDLQNPQVSSPAMRAIFWPWRWSMAQARVYMLDQAGSVLPYQDVALTTPATTLDSIRSGLEKKFVEESISPDQKNLIWQLTSDRVSTLTPRIKPWHTLLGKVSTFPYPVPQALHLSYIFYVSIENNVQNIFAAPILSAGTPFPSADTRPGIPRFQTDPRVLIADYDGVAELALQAYSAPCNINVPSGDFIDPVTQWVNDPDGNNYFDEDWLASLESRMSDALDLSHAMILFLKDPAQTPLLLQADNLRLFTSMTLAALADIVGPGLVPPPDGVRLIDKLLVAANLPPLSPSEVAALLQISPYSSVKDVRKLISDVFVNQRKQGAAGAPGTDYAILRADPARISLQQTITELEGVRGFLLQADRERNTLLAFAGAQWKRLFDLAGLPARSAQVPKMMQMADPGTAVDPTQLYTDPRIRDLRRQMALSNLGRFWASLIHSNPPGDTNGRALVQKGFPAFFEYYYVQRFALNITIPPGGATLPPAKSIKFDPPWIDAVPSNLAQAIFNHIQSLASNLVNNLLPELPKQNGAAANPPLAANPAQLNETPHAITLQVEQLSPLKDESTAFSDILNRFSGVGILMREAGNPNWLCLNRADLMVNQQILDLGGDPTLIPLRISYRNDLRQVCASYDNRPLIADSPLSQPDITGWISDQKSPFDTLITHRYSLKAKMPTLTFGRQYQFAIFAIANCGAIPRALTSGNPYQLAASLGDSTTSGVTLRTVPYKRRVRIGASRITDIGQPTRPINAPVIPANVHPRARDIEALKLLETPEGATKTQLSASQAPLILLSPRGWELGATKVDAQITRPGTHWDTWHRWMKPNTSDDVQQGVIADFFRTAKANATNPTPSSLTVDDPALAPWFYFDLRECLDDGTLKTVAHRWVPIAPPPAGDVGLKSQRSRAVPFTCQWTDQPAQVGITKRDPVNGNPGLPEGAVILVLEGHVYRLGIYCAISPEDVSERFAPNIVDPAAPSITNDQDGKPYLTVSPQFLAVEVATGNLPGADAVWRALIPDQAAALTGMVNVNLGSVSPHLHRAELTRQVWRWQGRNINMARPHPNLISPPLSATDLEERIIQWEAVEFGDRSDSDATIIPMRHNPPQPNGARSFRYSEVLQNNQGDSDLRSLHFRFAVTVFSRYEGLMPPSVPRSVAALRKVPPENVVESPWTRLFVPCRRKDGGNPPRLRLIVPLTDTDTTDAAQSPGLLVVFDEPWHETGGLVEQLQARIALTADPSEDPANLKHYYIEMGPDPIVGHQPLVAKPIDMSLGQPAPVAWPPIVGPVGHYFDATNSAALFTCSSFIIPAPALNVTGAGQDRRWVFAKLQFRRMLVTSLREVRQPNGREPRVDVADAVYSPFTDPLWTQFLPSFSVFESVSFVPEQLKIDLQGKVLSILNKDGSPCRLSPMPSDNGSYSLYVVMTRQVFDVTGRADQEQFAGLFSQGGTNQWNLIYPADAYKQAAPELGYRVRVIEVQRPQPATGTDQTLWDELFQTTADSDTPVRIVRISDPINYGGTDRDVNSCGGN